MTEQMRVCGQEGCGADISDRDPSIRYCAPCAEKRQVQAWEHEINCWEKMAERNLGRYEAGLVLWPFTPPTPKILELQRKCLEFHEANRR